MHIAHHKLSKLGLVCPRCKRPIRMASTCDAMDPELAPPEPGAFTVCFACGQISQLQDDGTLHEISDAELLTLPRAFSAQLRSLRRTIRQRLERLN